MTDLTPAPRVTLADIDAAVAAESFFTAGDACRALNHPHLPSADLLTLCILTLRNGFVVVGKSACASPANFDAAVGQRLAREDAIRQCWPLFGFALRDRLAAEAA